MGKLGTCVCVAKVPAESLPSNTFWGMMWLREACFPLLVLLHMSQSLSGMESGVPKASLPAQSPAKIKPLLLRSTGLASA